MAESQSRKVEGEETRSQFPEVMDPLSAESAFSSVQIESSTQYTPVFKNNVRILGQIYDTVQRYLSGSYRKSESFYPTLADVHQELQRHKRTINDKIPVPQPDDFELLCWVLADENPPFILFLRELDCGLKGNLHATTRMVSPTKKHEDKVQMALQSVMRNSIAALHDFLSVRGEKFPWEQALLDFTSAYQSTFKNGRLDQILRMMYIAAPSGMQLSPDLVPRLARLNASIKRLIIRPLLQQMVREGLCVVFSGADIRKSGIVGGEKYPDIILLQHAGQLERRYDAAKKALDMPWCREFQDAHQRTILDISREKGEIDEDEAYAKLSDSMLSGLKSAQMVPEAVLDVVVEIHHLSRWRTRYLREKKRTEEENTIRELIAKIRKYGNLFSAKKGQKYSVSKEYLKMALQGRIPGILATVLPYDNFEEIRGGPNPDAYENVFLIYKNRKNIGTAIDGIVSVFNKTGDVLLLRVMENILGFGRVSEEKMKEYVAPVHIESIKQAMKVSYRSKLPFFKRILMLIFSSELDEEKILRYQSDERMKSVRQMRVKRSKLEGQQVESAKRQVRRHAKETIRDSDSEKNLFDVETMGILLRVIGSYWDRGLFPSGDDIVRDMKTELREEAKKILDLSTARAKSIKDLICIETREGERTYASKKYLKENRKDLLDKFKARLADRGEIRMDNRVMTRKGATGDGREAFYRAAMDLLQRMS